VLFAEQRRNGTLRVTENYELQILKIVLVTVFLIPARVIMASPVASQALHPHIFMAAINVMQRYKLFKQFHFLTHIN
jgi:hypothetical protein